MTDVTLPEAVRLLERIESLASIVGYSDGESPSCRFCHHYKQYGHGDHCVIGQARAFVAAYKANPPSETALLSACQAFMKAFDDGELMIVGTPVHELIQGLRAALLPSPAERDDEPAYHHVPFQDAGTRKVKYTDGGPLKPREVEEPTVKEFLPVAPAAPAFQANDLVECNRKIGELSVGALYRVESFLVPDSNATIGPNKPCIELKQNLGMMYPAICFRLVHRPASIELGKVVEAIRGFISELPDNRFGNNASREIVRLATRLGITPEELQ